MDFEAFPDTPTVAALPVGNGAELFENWTANSPITGVIDRFDPKGTLKLIEQLQPDTKRVILIVGAGESTTDSLEGFTKRELAEHEGPVELEYRIGLPIETLLTRASRRSVGGTAVMFLRVTEDRTGRRLLSRRRARECDEGGHGARVWPPVSPPGLGDCCQQCGQRRDGSVHSRKNDVADPSWRACSEHLRSRLSGSRPDGDLASAAALGDQRAKTPKGHDGPRQGPTAWQLYRRYIVGVAGVVGVQAIVIGWLLLRASKTAPRRTGSRAAVGGDANATADDQHLDRRAAMGEVTAAITHEINQPLEAILHNAEAGEMMLESGSASPEELRAIFADIRRIDTRAAEMIQRLRCLLRKKDLKCNRSTSIDLRARPPPS